MIRRCAIFLLLTIVSEPLLAARASEDPRDRLRIAGIVLKWIRTDRAANFARVEPLVRAAAAGGAQIVCTTESFLDGYAIDDKSIPLTELRELGETIPGGQYYERLRELADELDIYLIAGLLERDGDHLYNTAILLGPHGDLLGKYHKQMLGHEAGRITPGGESSVFDTPFGKVGVMICADRRNEDVVRQFCSLGAELLICPSGGMFGPEKNDHILQRRSRENGKYIVFTHPAEFLVTSPAGGIVQRVLLGNEMKLSDDEVDTAEDSSGVFFFNLQRSAGQWRASAVSRALGQPLLKNGLSKEEVRTYVAARIPSIESPSSKEAWMEEASQLRKQFLRRVVFRGEAANWRDAETHVKWFDTTEAGDGYRIRKFRYEAVPGFWIPALLYEPTNLAGAAPVVINVNGHHRGGKAMPYKQRRCINLARRGVLAISLEFIDMGQLRDRANKHNRLVQLDLCGTSGVAVFHLALERGLDVALSHEYADPQRVGVTGLSGGGWQSIWLAALDTRITLANPVAGYCSIFARIRGDNNIGDAEQIPSDLCSVADYTHLTAMMAPRPLLLTYNAQDDCCFVPDQVLERLETVGRDVYGLCDAIENFQIHINHDPGTHNYDRDNREAFYRLLHRHMLDPESTQQPDDLPVGDAEIKTGEELAVPMPSRNLTLHDLATQLSRSLPGDAATLTEKRDAARWREGQRELLREIVRQPEYEATADLVDQVDEDELSILHWRLKLDDDWTVPVIEFRPSRASDTCIIVSDWGKESIASEIEQLVAAGKRVIAVDLLGFGETDPGSGPRSHDDVILMMIATVGDRPLGVQAAQLTAVAQWATGNSVERTPKIFAVGPRNSMIALVSAALNPGVTSGLELRQAWKSLREIIRLNMKAEDAPEQFCFGLLKEFDVPQLVALAGPQPVAFDAPERNKK